MGQCWDQPVVGTSGAVGYDIRDVAMTRAGQELSSSTGRERGRDGPMPVGR